ncbi:MAG TPA: tellurite resistance TerB family protein [Geminicoccus sp.]|uniref:tellurite resistance TerB family protein n=1 Tax=Geminicoccus sp. TaxID=2024832 RepID=UPI002E33E859|nr:tellurite resistance TerB family protein [Geminicoccus sp.]HEX2527514.1 tellurite resistance TerB family protein [Geminicoccus sp.]
MSLFARQQKALVSTMVLIAAAEGEMTDAELGMIGRLVSTLPVFKDFDRESITEIGRHVALLLQKSRGVDELINDIKDSLDKPLRETAYLLACDVAAADGTAGQEELEVLQSMRDWLELEPLVASAIERAAAARFRRHH